MKQYVHISFDDVYECMQDMTIHSKEYKSVFENRLFAWMQSMHNLYGAVFTLNVFNQVTFDEKYDISAFPNTYAEELRKNSHWLKFAFHAKDDMTKYVIDDREAVQADYEVFVSAIMKATGWNEDSIDHVSRLGFFEGTLENLRALRDAKHGIYGFLTADNSDTRSSYFFDEERIHKVNQNGFFYEEEEELLFIKSQLRMEYVKSVEEQWKRIADYKDCKVIELFTHEYCFHDAAVRELLEKYIVWAYEKGYGFDFTENVYPYKQR